MSGRQSRNAIVLRPKKATGKSAFYCHFRIEELEDIDESAFFDEQNRSRLGKSIEQIFNQKQGKSQVFKIGEDGDLLKGSDNLFRGGSGKGIVRLIA